MTSARYRFGSRSSFRRLRWHAALARLAEAKGAGIDSEATSSRPVICCAACQGVLFQNDNSKALLAVLDDASGYQFESKTLDIGLVCFLIRFCVQMVLRFRVQMVLFNNSDEELLAVQHEVADNADCDEFL